MIRKIVAPTDFSELSKVGIRYALTIARLCEAELIILHVLPSLGHTVIPGIITRIMEDVSENAEAELIRISDELKPHYSKIRYDIVFYPSVEEGLQGYAELNAIDLIVIASKGGTGLKRVLFGSNTIAVVNKCNTTVIVVPEHTRIRNPEQLIYASDLTNLENEVRLLIPFAQTLDTTIEIVHLQSSEDPKLQVTEARVNSLKVQTGFTKIDLKILEGENIHDALRNHAIKRTMSLLVLFTRDISFLEQIFEKSIARELAWDNKVPLLIIRR